MSTDLLACRTLWIGDIQSHWTEEYVRALFSGLGINFSVKLIRDKVTGYSSGYGFIEFDDHQSAKMVLEKYNNLPIVGTALRIRLNWGAGGRRIESPADYSLFVGDLSIDMTDVMLFKLFAEKYSSVLGAKIVIDFVTGTSKGFGFVRFSNEEDRDNAFSLNGTFCLGKSIRVAPASRRNRLIEEQQQLNEEKGVIHGGDSLNSTIFIGGLSPAVTEEMLNSVFKNIGPTLYVKIPPGRGCGFVSYVKRATAEVALRELQGVEIGGCKIRLCWGKSTWERQSKIFSSSSPFTTISPPLGNSEILPRFSSAIGPYLIYPSPPFLSYPHPYFLLPENGFTPVIQPSNITVGQHIHNINSSMMPTAPYIFNPVPQSSLSYPGVQYNANYVSNIYYQEPAQYLEDESLKVSSEVSRSGKSSSMHVDAFNAASDAVHKMNIGGASIISKSTDVSQ